MAETKIAHAPGIITISDAYTTLGYCRYDDDGLIEYLFVHPQHRRRGLGLTLLMMVETKLAKQLSFAEPISPSGATLIAAYRARQPKEG
jgi:GNAT superfamily N-acetyltransferase